MTEETKAMDVRERDVVDTQGVERLRASPTFIPRADIYETDENILVIVDLPGVSEDGIDVTLEKNTLTIRGISALDSQDGYSLAFAEFEAGNYERSFRLTDQVDREGIHALYQDGVLRLTLPKAEHAKARKIPITTQS